MRLRKAQNEVVPEKKEEGRNYRIQKLKGE